MKASDVTDTLELALQASGCDRVEVRHKPRLLSDNGASYISSELAEWLDDNGMDHVRGAPYRVGEAELLDRYLNLLKLPMGVRSGIAPVGLEAIDRPVFDCKRLRTRRSIGHDLCHFLPPLFQCIRSP